MDKNSPDDILLEGIREDSELAFKALFDKYYRSICYASAKIYNDPHKSKDFAQEVFLDVWKKRKTIKIHSSLGAFLRRAVVNKTIDYIRSQRFDFDDSPDLGDKQIQQSNSLEYSELKDLIHQTADQLPDRCRLVFMMSRFEEMSHKEIAKKLEISEKTVENQITKALKLLRSVVAKYMAESKIIIQFLSIFIGDKII